MKKTDTIIIGAGPVGLFAVHQLGIKGLNSIVIDNLDKAGGQCIELYPDKPIYDIPAVPECTGEELTKKLLEQIRDQELPENYLSELGKDKMQSLTLNSIRDNKKFEINSVQMLYSLPINSFSLISDENDRIYLAKIIDYKDANLNKDDDDYKSFINKENTNLRKSILKSYDYLLNDKYDVTVNQIAINNVKNLFQ